MATPVHVQQWGHYNTPPGAFTSNAAASSGAVTSGNAVLVFVSVLGNATFTATDSAGNTYTPLTGTFDSGLGFSLQGLYCLNVTGANPLTVTITASGTFDKWRVWIHEVSNLSAFDGSNVSHGSANATSGTITPTVSGDFLLGCGVNNAGTVGAEGSGWTAGFTAGSEDSEYRIYASTAAIAATYTNDGGAYVGGIMAFKPSGAAPASTPAPFLMLLGCGS